MADNFDMKKFLTENKLGPYAKAKINENEMNEGEDFSMEEAKEESNENMNVASRIMAYADENKDKASLEDTISGMLKYMSKEKILQYLKQILVSTKLNEKVTSNKEKVEEAMRLKPKGFYQILDAGTNEWNDDFQYIGAIDGGSSVGEIGDHMFLAPTGPGAFVFVNISDTDLDTMVKPSMSEGKEKEEEAFGGINEALEPHVYERMYNLSNIKAQQAMIRAAEILMNDLTAEGFEVPEIREFFTQLIANDI